MMIDNGILQLELLLIFGTPTYELVIDAFTRGVWPANKCAKAALQRSEMWVPKMPHVVFFVSKYPKLEKTLTPVDSSNCKNH